MRNRPQFIKTPCDITVWEPVETFFAGEPFAEWERELLLDHSQTYAGISAFVSIVPAGTRLRIR